MRNFIGAAVVLTIATSLCACVEPESSDVLDSEVGTFQQAYGTRGSIGSNKLSNDDFIPLQSHLAKAARLYGLVLPNNEVNPDILTELPGPSGLNVLRYAVACTVPDGAHITAGGEELKGLGHLKNGAAWLDGPLPHATINELMACMALHVNAYNVSVPILLHGGQVLDDPDGYPDFTVSEALWMADVNSDDVPFYTVWPSKYVAQSCVDVLSAFKDRVCGQWSTGCHFDVGAPGACTEDALGNYTCLSSNTPVIETWLAPADVSSLWPGCRN